jgi:phage repressor protein C with HTH and peptisase S24 domain
MLQQLFIVGRKLAALRVERLLTQAELAGELDMSLGGVRRLEQAPVGAIQIRNFRKLAELTHLSADQLRSRIGALSLPEATPRVPTRQPSSVSPGSRQRVSDVARFHGVSAARGAERADVDRGHVPVPVSSERRFAAVVDGDCMEPRYHNGDVVVFSVDAAESEGILDGRNYFIQFTDGENTFKRICFDPEDADRLVLRCWNTRYPMRTIERSEIALLARAVYRVIPDE